MGRLRWYVNRLRAMSAAEVSHRLRETILRHLSRIRPLDPGTRLLPGAENCLPEIPDLRAGLLRLAAGTDLATALASQATAVARGDITVFGRPWTCMHPDQHVPVWYGAALPVPDWHRAPDSREAWPRDRYCFDIPYRHGVVQAGGDVKYVWELNRLTYLQSVAAHACLSGDERARRICIQHLWNWLERNPPFRGINWTSGIELAIRSLSMMIVVTLLDPRSLPLPLRRRLAESLAAHGYWLARFPSRHSSANNHLVAELGGLLLLGLLFRGARDGDSWTQDGRRGLEAEICRQILDDGVGAEQSPAYAALSLEWFALAARVAALCRTPMTAAYLRRLSLAAIWLQAMSDRDDLVPDIGDADGSSLIAPEVPQALYPAAVRGILASLLGQPELAPRQVVPGLRHALFGLPSPGASAPDGLHCFADGGISAMRWQSRAGEALVVFDHGPLGYLSIAAHGHADALAVWLHLDGRPVLVDAGTWLYFGAGAWRDHFRGTAAHNTLELDGCDSSRISGPFNWSSKAVSRLLEAVEDAQDWRLVAEHDGYRTSHGCCHRRTIRRSGDRIVIEDELIGIGTALPVETGFQFAPDLTVSGSSDGWIVARAGRPLLSLQHVGGLDGSVAAGATDPPRGWVSLRFGEKCPAPRLAFEGQVRAGEKQIYILTLTDEGGG